MNKLKNYKSLFEINKCIIRNYEQINFTIAVIIILNSNNTKKRIHDKSKSNPSS